MCLPTPRGSSEDGETAAPERLTARGVALASHVGTLRRRLRTWLDTADCDGDAADDLILATSEALENCVDHAYRGLAEPGPMTLCADVVGGDVVIGVCDDGHWREPDAEPGHRGRGLALIRSIAADSEVATDDNGTHVTIRRALGGPSPSGA